MSGVYSYCRDQSIQEGWVHVVGAFGPFGPDVNSRWPDYSFIGVSGVFRELGS